MGQALISKENKKGNHQSIKKGKGWLRNIRKQKLTNSLLLALQILATCCQASLVQQCVPAEEDENYEFLNAMMKGKYYRGT